MDLKKIRDTHAGAIIAVFVIVFAIYTYLSLGNSPEMFTAIATIALVVATIYLAYFTKKLWLAKDKPRLDFKIVEKEIDKIDRQDLYVENIGKGAAFDVKFKINLNNKSIKNKFYKTLLSNEKILVCMREEFESASKIEIKEITYSDINENPIEQKPEIIIRPRRSITYSKKVLK